MIGPDTKIIAIGAHDPLGINPSTSTFVDMVSKPFSFHELCLGSYKKKNTFISERVRCNKINC